MRPAFGGDVVRLDGVRYMVLSSCGRATRARVCVTHQELLANECQLEFHRELAAGEECIVARMCASHGPEALDQ